MRPETNGPWRKGLRAESRRPKRIVPTFTSHRWSNGLPVVKITLKNT